MAKRFLLLSLMVSAACVASPAFADDFSDTIAYAYAHHPDIRSAGENLEAVRDTIWEAHGGYQPTIIANYERGRKRFQFDGSDQKYVNTTTKQLNVTQPIFRGGATIAQIKAARALTRAEEARFFNTGQEVLLNAISAYTRVIEAEKILEINRDNVARLERHVDATHTRRKAKDLTLTDVALSESRLSRAESSLRDAEGAYDSARATFFREIGKQPDVKELPSLPESLPSTEEEIVKLSQKHPNMIIANEQEKAADSTIDTRVSSILPSVNLLGKLEDQEGISTLSSSLDSLREDSIMLRVSIPLYQSGAEYARISQARHRYQKARSDTADTARDTRENALNAWHDYVAAKGSVESNERAFEAAQKAFGGIQEEYKYGARTVLDVLDTQQELFVTQQGLVRAQAREIIGAYRLLAAVGQLDTTTLKLNTKKYEQESEPVTQKASSGKQASSNSALKMPSEMDLSAPAEMASAQEAAETPYRIDLTLPPDARKNDITWLEPAAGNDTLSKKSKKKDKDNSHFKAAPNARLAKPVDAVKIAEPQALPEPEEVTNSAERDPFSLPSIAKRRTR